MASIPELEALAQRWEKEALGYMRLAAIPIGSPPAASNPQQSACSYSAGTYRTCAHELKLFIKQLKLEEKTQQSA